METSEKQTFENIQILAVRRACAHLSEKEILEAERVFKNHIKIVAGIVDRLTDEALTEPKYRSSLNSGNTNHNG